MFIEADNIILDWPSKDNNLRIVKFQKRVSFKTLQLQIISLVSITDQLELLPNSNGIRSHGAH